MKHVLNPEPATRGVLEKKVLSRILQYSQKNTCVEAIFIKVDSNTGFSCEYNKYFLQQLFEKDLRTAASLSRLLVWVQANKVTKRFSLNNYLEK